MKYTLSPRQAFCLITLIGISSRLVWADSVHESEKPEAPRWYACPVAAERVIYTTEPQDVQCQIALYPPADKSDLKSRSLDIQNSSGIEQLQRLWYSAEFSHDRELNSHTIVSIPKIGIHLRQSPAILPTGKPERTASIAPVKPQPKPLTPRQLVQRDIQKEQIALNSAQQQLKQAQKQANSTQIQHWQENIASRIANIRVLKQELRRY